MIRASPPQFGVAALPPFVSRTFARRAPPSTAAGRLVKTRDMGELLGAFVILGLAALVGVSAGMFSEIVRAAARERTDEIL